VGEGESGREGGQDHWIAQGKSIRPNIGERWEKGRVGEKEAGIAV